MGLGRPQRDMGRSAKLHKRVKKTASSVSQAPKHTTAPPVAPKDQNAAGASANVKRRAGLKEIASGATLRKRTGSSSQGHVLGGADYVSLMMGGRRRAREEAEKLPPA